MNQQATKLMSKFADVNLLKEREFTFQVYVLKKIDYLYRSEDISYPSPFGKVEHYFNAEVRLKINLRGGYVYYKHAFQLDIASLKYELELIDPEKAELLIIPDRIANILTERYHEVAEYLSDYNDDKDLYREIALLFHKYYGLSIGTIYNI